MNDHVLSPLSPFLLLAATSLATEHAVIVHASIYSQTELWFVIWQSAVWPFHSLLLPTCARKPPPWPTHENIQNWRAPLNQIDGAADPSVWWFTGSSLKIWGDYPHSIPKMTFHKIFSPDKQPQFRGLPLGPLFDEWWTKTYLLWHDIHQLPQQINTNHQQIHQPCTTSPQELPMQFSTSFYRCSPL